MRACQNLREVSDARTFLHSYVTKLGQFCRAGRYSNCICQCLDDTDHRLTIDFPLMNTQYKLSVKAAKNLLNYCLLV